MFLLHIPFHSVVRMFIVCVVLRVQGIPFRLERMDACCSCVVLGIHVHTSTCLDLPLTVVVVVIAVLPVVAVGTISALAFLSRIHLGL